jgi:hypothetical protein
LIAASAAKEILMRRYVSYAVAAVVLGLMPFSQALAQQALRGAVKKTIPLPPRPDLRPDVLVTGLNVQGTKATVTVANQGKGLAGLERLKLQVLRGTEVLGTGFAALPTIAPGKSITVQMEARNSAQAVIRLDLPATRLVLTADDAGNIAESNERNNVFTKNNPPAGFPFRPDVLVTSVKVQGTTARVKVKNQGTIVAGLERLKLQVFRGTQVLATGFAALPTIGPGKAVDMNIVARDTAGKLSRLDLPGTRLVFTADDAGNIAESNEANNVFTHVNPPILPSGGLRR